MFIFKNTIYKNTFFYILLWITLSTKYTIGILSNVNQLEFNNHQHNLQNFLHNYYHQYLSRSRSYIQNDINKLKGLHLSEQIVKLNYPEKTNFTDIESSISPIVFPISIRNKRFIRNNFDARIQEINFKYYIPNPNINPDELENFSNNYFEKNEPRNNLATVFPGTIWCGPGNKAPSENSLGIFHRTDICCRDHDKCPNTILPNEMKMGLINKGIFTKSHCDCDREFYYCLREANTIVSYKVGFAYFNLLRPQCFREEHPVIECTEWYLKKCLNYVVDESQEKIWQWFDNQMF